MRTAVSSGTTLALTGDDDAAADESAAAALDEAVVLIPPPSRCRSLAFIEGTTNLSMEPGTGGERRAESTDEASCFLSTSLSPRLLEEEQARGHEIDVHQQERESAATPAPLFSLSGAPLFLLPELPPPLSLSLLRLPLFL